MNKTIIGIYGGADEGKSETIKNVCKILVANFPNAQSKPLNINYDTDILVIIELGNVKIGIESQGDPNSRMITEDTVKKLNGCDIIICATRTRGETVNKVYEMQKEYNILWISSFYCPQLNHDVLNRIAAENIIEIIKSLIVGQL